MRPTAVTIRRIKKRALAWLGEKYPGYEVTVEPSFDDPYVLLVRVFAVPEPQVDTIFNEIIAFGDEFLEVNGILLLPMIKNEETTAKYYTEKFFKNTEKA